MVTHGRIRSIILSIRRRYFVQYTLPVKLLSAIFEVDVAEYHVQTLVPKGLWLWDWLNPYGKKNPYILYKWLLLSCYFFSKHEGTANSKKKWWSNCSDRYLKKMIFKEKKHSLLMHVKNLGSPRSSQSCNKFRPENITRSDPEAFPITRSEKICR